MRSVTDLSGPSLVASGVPILESFGHDVLLYFWLQLFPRAALHVCRTAGAGVGCWKVREQRWSALTPAAKLVMASLITFSEIFSPFFFLKKSSWRHVNISKITDFIYLLKNLSF